MRPYAASALALLLSAAPAFAQSGVIAGTVYDSLHSAPLSQATIIATASSNRDTEFHSATSDDNGRFRIVGLLPGRYVLTVEHEALDSIGIHVPEATIEVLAAGNTAPASLATPSRRTFLGALCPQIADSAGLGVLLGVVRQVDGATVSGANVVASWTDFTVDSKTASVTNKTFTTNGATDGRGVYRLCGLPVERSLFVQAQNGPASQSGVIEEKISNAGVQVRDFRIAMEVAGARDTSTAPVPSAVVPAPAMSGIFVSGIISDLTGRPIEGAQVNLPGAPRSTTTNDRGEFRLGGVTPGTQSVEVVAIGFYPRSLRVDLDAASPPMKIRMERLAVVLDSMNVIAQRSAKYVNMNHRDFDTRRRSGLGSFMSHAGIDSIRPMSLYDVLRRLQGVRITPNRSGWGYIVSATRSVSNFRGETCRMPIYLDGIPVDADVLAGYPPEAAYGVEVQSSATAPVKYHVGPCGAVFVWTR